MICVPSAVPSLSSVFLLPEGHFPLPCVNDVGAIYSKPIA